MAVVSIPATTIQVMLAKQANFLSKDSTPNRNWQEATIEKKHQLSIQMKSILEQALIQTTHEIAPQHQF